MWSESNQQNVGNNTAKIQNKYNSFKGTNLQNSNRFRLNKAISLKYDYYFSIKCVKVLT